MTSHVIWADPQVKMLGQGIMLGQGPLTFLILWTASPQSHEIEATHFFRVSFLSSQPRDSLSECIGLASSFGALLVGWLVFVARGLYLAIHLFTLYFIIQITEKLRLAM